MHFIIRTLASSLAIALLLPACGDDGGGTATAGGSSTGTTTGNGNTTTGDTPTTTGGPDDTTSGTTETVEPTTTGVDPTTTTGEEQTTTTGATTTTEPETGSSTTMPGTTTGDPVQECLDMVPPGEACAECACMSCPDEFQACQADPGCVAIRECAQENMCSGADCIVPCGQVINDNGGLGGQPAMKAIALGMCISMSCGERCGV